MADYSADLTLWIGETGGNFAAAQDSMHDPYNGWAHVILGFTPEPGECYTAKGYHRMRISMWDYAPSFPYQIQYFDDWYFSSFQAQNIYNPFAYQFTSPGYFQHRRTSQIIPLGTTYAEACAPPGVQKIQYKVGNSWADLPSRVADVILLQLIMVGPVSAVSQILILTSRLLAIRLFQRITRDILQTFQC